MMNAPEPNPTGTEKGINPCNNAFRKSGLGWGDGVCAAFPLRKQNEALLLFTLVWNYIICLDNVN